MRANRRRLFIDAEVQGLVLVQTIAHWVLCLACVTLAFVGWQLLFGAPKSISEHLAGSWNALGPAIVVCLLMLPIVAWDSIRISNRFAGPMYRFRRATKQLANGDVTNLITLRDKDCWKGLAQDFNQLTRRIEILQQERDLAIVEKTTIR